MRCIRRKFDVHIQLVQFVGFTFAASVSMSRALIAGLSSQFLQSASEASMTIDTNMMAKNEMPDEEEQQQSVGRRLLVPRIPRIHGQSVLHENEQ